MAVAGTAVAVAFAVALLHRCGYGFDLTDEGFYLNWIEAPQHFKVSITQFGFVYHPLYELVGGSLVTLRRANLLITLCLAWTVCLALTRKLAPLPGQSDRSHYLLATILATGALGSLLYSCRWLPAPSYNSLAFQAILVSALALAAADREPRHASAAGAVLGFALWLAALAKPTTAVGLGVLSTVCLLVAGQLTVRLASVALATSTVLLAAFALVIDGSLVSFGRRLVGGLEDGRLLSADYSLRGVLRVDGFWFSAVEGKAFVAVFAAVAAVTSVLVAVAIRRDRVARAAWGVLSVAVCVFAVYLWQGIWYGLPDALLIALRPGRFQGLQLIAVVAGTVVGLAASVRSRDSTGRTRNGIASVVFLAFCPYAYALGTSGNYWLAASNVGALWLWTCVPLALTAAPERGRRALLSIGLFGQCITIGLMLVGLENPYRQAGPLRMNTDTARLARVEGLVLSRSSARYLATLAGLASARGFAIGTPVIDLTGYYPGALYAMAATPLGHAWMIGGYPRSAAFAAAGLDRVPCGELARAWLLEEPGGPHAIPTRILERYGIDAARDFEVVGRLDSPAEDDPTSERQHLLKPLRASKPAEAACEATRARTASARVSQLR